ncbi:MAG: peroxiredoxin family protein [Armatimonadota bacterium]
MKISYRRTAILTVITAILISAALTAVYAALSAGTKAPEFKLKSINGKTVTLSQLRNDPINKGAKRVVLLDFWATWCPPCRNEVPHLQKLHEKYGKKGLVVVGIALDDGGASDVKPFAKENGLKYTMLVDPAGTTAKKYGVRPIPTTFIIGKDGVIKNMHLGFSPGMEDELEKEIKALL